MLKRRSYILTELKINVYVFYFNSFVSATAYFVCFLFEALDFFCWLNRAKNNVFFLMVFSIFFVFCVKKTAVNDLQKLKSTLLASHVGTHVRIR